MAIIQPEGERLRQAVRWISEMHLENKKKDFSQLIQAASLKYNLSPKEETFLISFYREKRE